MCDKRSMRSIEYAMFDTKITKPKSAYALLMEKQRHQQTVWFIDEKCETCGKDILTNGEIFWCSESCIQNGTLGKDRKDYMGFINDLIR